MRQIIFFYNYIRLAIKMKSKQQQQQQQKAVTPRITEFMFLLLLPLKPSSQILS